MHKQRIVAYCTHSIEYRDGIKEDDCGGSTGSEPRTENGDGRET